MIVIIGAGVSGLTVAHNLPSGTKKIVLEKSDVPGGLATQFFSGGYWFDYGGHYFHFQGKPQVQTYLEQFTGFKTYKRVSKTFLLNRYIPFPVQFHLAHLPAAQKKKVYAEMSALAANPKPAAADMKSFLVNHMGETLTDLFFEPFLSKYYVTDIRRLAANMDKGSIPVPDRKQVDAGFKGKTFETAGYNPVILYPKPSLRHFIKNYAQPLQESIRFNQEVREIDCAAKTVRTDNGIFQYDQLVSTIPLNQLLNLIKPQGRFPGSEELKHTSTLLVNAVLKRKRKRFHWVYSAERQFPFYRVGLYAGQHAPICYLERNILPGSIDVVDRDALSKDIDYTLKALGVIIDSAEISYFDARIIPVSYVIFDRTRQQIVPPLLAGLKAVNIHSIGRYGTWNYSSMAGDIKDALDYVATNL